MSPSPGFRPQALLSFPFFLLGLTALLTLGVWLVVQPAVVTMPVRAPQLLALVHLALLGWVAPFVFGAAYQLIPVIAETPLWSRSAAWVHFALHLVGAPLLILAMARGNFSQAGPWGGLVALGALIAVGNLLLTANRRSRWSPDNVGLVLALFWLAVAVGLGVLLALVRSGRLTGIGAEPVVRLHLASGLAGFFLGTLMAVSFKLVPMFLLCAPGVRWRQWLVLGLLFSGLMTLGMGLFADNPQVGLVAAAELGAAGITFLFEIGAMVGRRLRAPDWPLRIYLVGIAMLVPAGAAGITALFAGDVAWQPARPGVATVALVVFGVLTPCTLGMAGKIVPFLAWQWRYAEHVGRSRVPLVSDLFRPALLRLQFFALAPAAVLLTVAMWVDSVFCLRLAAVGLLLGALTLALNLAGLMPHLLKPRLASLSAGQPVKPNQTAALAAPRLRP